jgi:uncharacterized protein
MSTATDRATIERAGRALIEAVAAPSKVLLFGSQSIDDAGEGTDYKFLVIEQEVDDRFGEMARLGALLGRLLIPAEVVVISVDQADKAGFAKGSLIHQALSQGRVIAES